MPSLPASFQDLPAECFPFVIDYIQASTGRVVYTQTVTGPMVLRVPGLATKYGRIKVRVRYANGRVEEEE